MKFRAAIPVLLVCSSLAVSGCSLIDPFVTWEPLEETKQQVKLTAVEVERIGSDAEHRDSLKRALAKIDLRTRDNVSMAQAMAYANRGKAAYNAALSEHAEVQSYLGIGLIPLTAAAMGLGATDRGTEPWEKASN